MLKQTVLSCWNKVFFPIGTLCSALIKQIVLYRRTLVSTKNFLVTSRLKIK